MNIRTTISSCALLALSAISCQTIIDEGEPVMEVREPQLVTLTCEYPGMVSPSGTKVTLDESGNAGWEVGDKIVIFGKSRTKVVHELVAGDIVDPSVAIFTEDLSGLVEDEAPHVYNAAFPADDFDFYSSNSYGRARFYETNQVLMAGYLDGDKIVLQNLCAAITFKVSGDFDTYVFTGRNGTEIVGYEDYLVEINNASPSYLKKQGEPYGTNGPKASITGPVINDGSSLNYVFIPNVADLSSGFTIKFAKNGVIKKTITSTAPLTLSHGHMVNLGLLPSEYMKDYVRPHVEVISAAERATASDLSSAENANSYIVSAEGTTNDDKVFSFKAVKGFPGAAVNDIASVDVVWETFNDATVPTKGEIINAVDWYGDYIYFKTPVSLHSGNALIAAKNDLGDIMWSWHIWVPEETPSDVIDATVFGSKGIMDRNLGALKAASSSAAATVYSYGLLYEWGRKDPFPGMAGLTTNSPAALCGVSMTMYNGTMTIDETIKSPTKYAWVESDDWADLSDRSNTLWTTTKTQYDPCPPEYIVPTRDKSVHYWGSTALNSLAASDNFADNGGTYYSYSIGSSTPVVFPYAGYIDNDSGSHYKAGARSLVWSSYASSAKVAYGRDSRHDSSSFERAEPARSRAGSVRCVRK